jgi:dTDP-4-dehydrorhamnose reductase
MALEQSGHLEVLALSHEQADCTRAVSVREALIDARPQAVINCAAFVRVDDCEVQAREAFEVNALGALNVARACAAIDATCVYISTDYVFDGAKSEPYVESDATCPINVYGASKVAGEHLVRQGARRWLIVRVASLFGTSGARGKAGNFVETILAKAGRGESLRVVSDIQISPTYTRDAARVLSELVQNETTGIIHAANSGACTWHEFAQAAVELCRLNVAIQAIPSVEYPTAARRPKNSALASERLGTPAPVPHWRDALRRYLIEKRYVG